MPIAALEVMIAILLTLGASATMLEGQQISDVLENPLTLPNLENSLEDTLGEEAIEQFKRSVADTIITSDDISAAQKIADGGVSASQLSENLMDKNLRDYFTENYGNLSTLNAGHSLTSSDGFTIDVRTKEFHKFGNDLYTGTYYHLLYRVTDSNGQFVEEFSDTPRKFSSIDGALPYFKFYIDDNGELALDYSVYSAYDGTTDIVIGSDEYPSKLNYYMDLQPNSDDDKTASLGSVTVDGVEYSLNPDGSVTINGITYYPNADGTFTIGNSVYDPVINLDAYNDEALLSLLSKILEAQGSVDLTDTNSILTNIMNTVSGIKSTLLLLPNIITGAVENILEFFSVDLGQISDVIDSQSERIKNHLGIPNIQKNIDNIGTVVLGQRIFDNDGNVLIKPVSTTGTSIKTQMPHIYFTLFGRTYDLFSGLYMFNGVIDLVKMIMSTFMWIGFILGLFRSLPRILGGVGSITKATKAGE